MTKPDDLTITKRALAIGKQVLVFLVLFILVSQVVDYWRGRELPKSAIPLANFTSIAGKSIDLNAQSEENLQIVYFWATWCGPCKITSPSVNRLASHYPVVSIAISSGTNHQLARYIEEEGYRFSVVNDNEGEISDRWQVPVTPVILYIKENRIVDFTTGPSAYPMMLWRAFWANYFS